MMNKLLFSAAIFFGASQAHAGIWESITGLFGGGKEQPAAVQPSAEPAGTSSAIEKGIALIPLLTQTLGVSQGQAQGGMGSLLQAAQILLSGTEFGTLVNSIPNSQALLSAAPLLQSAKKAEGADLLSKAMATAAEHSETAKAGTQLLGQFKQLGLSADMIPKFTNTTKTFLEQSDKNEASALLGQVGQLF